MGSALMGAGLSALSTTVSFAIVVGVLILVAGLGEPDIDVDGPGSPWIVAGALVLGVVVGLWS